MTFKERGSTSLHTVPYGNDANIDIHQGLVRRKERAERFIFWAFGAYLVAVTLAFVALR